jgi:hypothetical protein
MPKAGSDLQENLQLGRSGRRGSQCQPSSCEPPSSAGRGAGKRCLNVLGHRRAMGDRDHADIATVRQTDNTCAHRLPRDDLAPANGVRAMG